MKVELELHVDGGGGIAGEEVARLAHQWTWKHGRKVHSTSSEWRELDWQSDQRVFVAEENHGLVASWRDAWIPKVFICISKKLHYHHSGEAISCDFWRWCRGLSSLVWHGNWKFAKKKHLFTNARYRWLVNMWTAYGGRKDLAAISLQRQTMRVDKTFVLTRPKPTYGRQGLAGL